jgi:hypothetical protein
MITKIKVSTLTFLCLFACLLALPTQAHGQTVYCASDDGNRHSCNMNTSGGVRMTNQRSGSACIQGQTWGWSRNSVWVDRGCRAEFTSGNGGGNWNGGGGGSWNGSGNGGNWNGGNNNSGTVYCASDDGKRHSCNMNTNGGVRLTNQRSGSACTQGQTWGWDRSGVWVDRGCRAEFTSGGGGGNWHGGGNGGNGGNWNGGGSSGTVYCASDDGKRHSCNMNTNGGVQLTNQRSGSACIQGQTWGWDRGGVWVDRGCRAEFQSNR